MDPGTGGERDYHMKLVHTMFYGLERLLRWNDSKVIVRNEFLGSFRAVAQKFEALVNETFDAHSKMGLYTLKLYLMDYNVESLEQIESLEMLNSSGYE